MAMRRILRDNDRKIVESCYFGKAAERRKKQKIKKETLSDIFIPFGSLFYSHYTIILIYSKFALFLP